VDGSFYRRDGSKRRGHDEGYNGSPRKHMKFGKMGRFSLLTVLNSEKMGRLDLLNILNTAMGRLDLFRIFSLERMGNLDIFVSRMLALARKRAY